MPMPSHLPRSRSMTPKNVKRRARTVAVNELLEIAREVVMAREAFRESPGNAVRTERFEHAVLLLCNKVAEIDRVG